MKPFPSTPRGIVIVAVGLVAGIAALIFFVTEQSLEHGEAFALATTWATSSPEVRARVGPIASTALAPGESTCLSQTMVPPAGEATFTVLVTGARDHAKLDVRATRDARGWRLVEARVRPTDDSPVAVTSSCTTGSAWGPAGNYGKP